MNYIEKMNEVEPQKPLRLPLESYRHEGPWNHDIAFTILLQRTFRKWRRHVYSKPEEEWNLFFLICRFMTLIHSNIVVMTWRSSLPLADISRPDIVQQLRVLQLRAVMSGVVRSKSEKQQLSCCLYEEKLSGVPGAPTAPNQRYRASVGKKKHVQGTVEIWTSVCSVWRRLGLARRVDSLETVYMRIKTLALPVS